MPMGGLSQALTTIDSATKKRPLSHHSSLHPDELPEAEHLPQHLSLRPRSALHHQLSEYQQKQQRLQSSSGNGNPSVPLSPLSATTPHSRGTTFSESLEFSGTSGQTLQPRAPLFTFNFGESDASDGENFDVGSMAASQAVPVGSLPWHLPGSCRTSAYTIPSLRPQHCDTSLDEQQGPSWAAYNEDCPSDEAASAPVSFATQRPALAASATCDEHETHSTSFRPGSVMEGAGRKLSGTEAMRVRNTVLRQTGFLELHSNNMFADHDAP